MNMDQIESWLKETEPKKLEQLWQMADKARSQTVGNQVHLRGLVEIGSYCVRRCQYCGLYAGNKNLVRYRMSEDEILDCVEKIVAAGFGTIVMQSGQDEGIKADWIAGVIKKIKQNTPLAVTLSLGERKLDEFKLWKDAGADRYLLRFETSDRKLYELIHPPIGNEKSDRIKMLQQLREIGYEIGGGVMVGTPGQSFSILAKDIDTFRKLDLDMVGIGPYISNPNAPMGQGKIVPKIEKSQQTDCDILTVSKAIALTRLLCPQANLPATTAVGTVDVEKGQLDVLQRGANVIMPNVTPAKYKSLYQVYPDKQSVFDGDNPEKIKAMLATIDRVAGVGRGDRQRL